MTGEEKKVNLSPQELANLLSSTVEKTIKAAQGKTGDYNLASKPFNKTVAEKDAERYERLVSKPKLEAEVRTKIEVFQTDTYLDKLFLDNNNKSLNGIPQVIQLGIGGLSGTGKSILAQEIAIKTASKGKRVVFLTSEDIYRSDTPRNDLEMRIKQKADVLGLNWGTICENLVVLDTITHTELRAFDTLIEVYRHIVESKGVDLLIVDSLTLLENYRQSLKHRLLALLRYNQLHGVTAIYVCQRSEEKPDTYAVSGGQGVVHNLDALLIIDFKKVAGQLKEDLNQARPKDQQLKQWSEVHFTRLMTCRLSGLDRTYYECEISSNGLLRLKYQQQRTVKP